MSTDKKFTRYNIVGRSGATLHAYLNGSLRDYFLSRDYVYGLAEQKNILHAKQSRAAAWMFGLTTLLAFFDSVVGTNVSFLGLSFVVKPVFSAAICFLAASAFFSVILRFIDILILDNYLRTVGQQVKIYSFGLYILPKCAINLWSEAASPRFYGSKSGVGHKIAFYGMLVVMLLFLLVVMLYPTLVCGSVILQTVQKPILSWSECALALISALTLIISWMLIILTVSPFKYFDADFSEVDGSPTEEFVQKVRAEQEIRQ